MGVEARGDASLGALRAWKPVEMPHWVRYGRGSLWRCLTGCTMGVEARGDASLGALWAWKPVVMAHCVHYGRGSPW